MIDFGCFLFDFQRGNIFIAFAFRGMGVRNAEINLLSTTMPLPVSAYTAHDIGLKGYELTNHLGNVLSTVSDKIIPIYSTTPMYYNTFDYPGGTYSPFLSNGTITMSIATSGELEAANASASNSIRHNITTVVGDTYRATSTNFLQQ